jgi:hypothetical protein
LRFRFSPPFNQKSRLCTECDSKRHILLNGFENGSMRGDSDGQEFLRLCFLRLDEAVGKGEQRRDRPTASELLALPFVSQEVAHRSEDGAGCRCGCDSQSHRPAHAP